MIVRDLMVSEVVICPLEATLQRAVVRILEHNVGSVIVTREDDPMGILTETDALLAGADTGEPFEEIPVQTVVSHPLITITADATLRKAVDRMAENDIKKLPVVDGLDLEGIITMSDIAMNHSDVVREARDRAQQRDRWESRRSPLDEW